MLVLYVIIIQIFVAYMMHTPFFSLVDVGFLFCVIFCMQQVNRLEITPNKHYLAAAGNPHIRLFDVNSNSPQPVHLLPKLLRYFSF